MFLKKIKNVFHRSLLLFVDDDVKVKKNLYFHVVD